MLTQQECLCVCVCVCVFCRCVQEIQLDKHVKLLDSPGVVMATNSGDTASMILRNCVKVCLHRHLKSGLASSLIL